MSDGSSDRHLIPMTSSEMEIVNQNNAAATARAFATYALVPYLGILFCPGALYHNGRGKP